MRSAQQGIFSPFPAASYRVAVVVAEFNSDITKALLQGTLAELAKYKIPKKNIDIFRVLGCVEIASVLAAVAQSKKYDCALALGAIIRGETDHYYYVADLVVRGVSSAMAKGLPVGFGVLTVDTKKQARARLDVGAQAAAAALHSARINRGIVSKRT